MTRTWILNGTVLTQDRRRRALKAHVLVEDGRIAKVTASSPGTPARRGAAHRPPFASTHP